MVANKYLWLAWIALTLVLAGGAFGRLYIGGDRLTFMPGETSGVHHQIELACETCHTSEPFAEQKTVLKDINKTCVTCHKDELKASNDSHPIKKFKNPRMAEYWDRVDARFCTSCHMEHQPEATLAGLVTLAGDFCVACHSEGEQDVRVNRPSHADLEFDTCASSGCHNFHDNRALYEDFLVKHAGQPWLADNPIHQGAAMARARARPMAQEIELYLASLPETAPSLPAPMAAIDSAEAAEIHADWAGSAHAAGDVGCADCHAPDAEGREAIEAAWIDVPGEEVCASCHRAEAKTFALGRHGMRRHPEIAKPRQAKKMLKQLGWKDAPDTVVASLEAYLDDPAPPPLMSTPEARVTLLPHTVAQELTCNTCHKPHEQDLQYAAVDACLTCHADDHSLAYKDSPHFGVWTAELAGEAEQGAGVTCATCHMPQVVKRDTVTTNHNQNDTLRPNEKMIRPVCMDCHSLEFSIDALADVDLVDRNFAGSPDRHIDSIDWAVRRVDQPDEGANQ